MKFDPQRKILQAYYDGERDRLDRKTPRPPKSGPERKAYLNGYHQKIAKK